MSATELRIKVYQITKEDFITLRDEMESNWNDSLREQMQLLSLVSVKRFGQTLSTL